MIQEVPTFSTVSSSRNVIRSHKTFPFGVCSKIARSPMANYASPINVSQTYPRPGPVHFRRQMIQANENQTRLFDTNPESESFTFCSVHTDQILESASSCFHTFLYPFFFISASVVKVCPVGGTNCRGSYWMFKTDQSQWS